jgi:hypothetical protein
VRFQHFNWEIMMAKQQPAQKTDGDTDLIEQGAKKLANAICLNIMAALGRPSDFLRITVRQVTESGYRVNVVTGADAASARIAHSFFITADAAGKVATSEPAIVKQY